MSTHMSLARPICEPRRPSPEELLELFVICFQLSWNCDETLDIEVEPHAKPLPIAELPKCAIRSGIIFWMMYHDYVRHYQLRASPADGILIGQRVQTLCLTESSTFVLTERGLDFAHSFLDEVLNGFDDGSGIGTAWERLILGRLLPYYEQQTRLFLWGEHILKHFRQPAGNQELILLAAEELGWRDWFDDPLPRRPKVNPKSLLHDTIKDLNRRQQTPLVHFKGDGTGMRIGWEFR